MRKTSGVFDVPVTLTSGTPIRVAECRNIIVSVEGEPFVATVRLDGRLEGGAWFPIADVTDGNAILPLPATLQVLHELRFTTTSYTSGVPTARWAGREVRDIYKGI